MSTRRICLWSGPRNVSTALMYSFAQRRDTRVVDEPLYAHYLQRTGVRHPGREEVLAAQDTDGARVLQEVVLGPVDRPVGFFKCMAHHLVGLDRSFLQQTVNLLLVRDPEEMLPSLVQQVPEPELPDTALPQQCELLEELRALGQDPPVLDARLLLDDPPGVLRRVCERLGLEFDEAMLRWPEGARPEDGIWAPYWYHALHRSSGFQPYRAKQEPFPETLSPLLEASRPYYDRLLAAARKES